MTWNYRVVKKGVYLSIHVCYYDENGDIEFLTENNINAFGETLDELVKDYARMAEAFKKPIIDFNTMKEI